MQTKRSVAPIGSRRTNVLILGVILVVVAITVSPLTWQRSATLLPAQLSSDTPAVRPALDQHERHAAGFPSDIYTPLDQHERHADLVARIPNPVALDLHELHQAACARPYTPLAPLNPLGHPVARQPST